ncbi:MAG: HlyD family type I secretion periplasmic adaptor subunit [Methylococcales bacterium]|nr:HlyD family type I secretion periplasmic adaptor subunit [Methylococcales bacterium]
MTDISNQTNTLLSVVTDDKPIRIIGYVIILLTFGIFGYWSTIAPIDSSVLATGTVTVKTHRKTVQHLDGGIMSKLLVKDGDVVKAGDALVLLDNTQIKAQIEMLRGQFITQKSLSDRLRSERDQLPTIKFSKELLAMRDDRVQEAVQGQTHIFTSRKNSYRGEIDVLKQRIQQLDSKVIGLNAQRSSKQKLVLSYQDEIKDLTDLLAQGFADKQRLRELERNYTTIIGEIATLASDIASTQMQRGETQLQIVQTEKKFQEDVATQQEEANAQLFDITERLHAVEDKDLQAVINEGGVITAGKPILDIVPEDEDLIISAQVSALDIDRIKLGAIAEVRFSAFSSKTTPTMEGVISKVSADSFVNETTGASYYLATVNLTEDSQKKLGSLKLMPGMPAEVLINAGERTLFEYLLQPLTDAFARSFIEE